MGQDTVNKNSFFKTAANGLSSSYLTDRIGYNATMAVALETAKLVDEQRIANLWAGAASDLLPWEVRRALKDEALKRMGVEVRGIEVDGWYWKRLGWLMHRRGL